MQLNENKFFRMTSRKMESCALYMYANQSTREAIINDIFHKLKYADFDARLKYQIPPMHGHANPSCRCGDILQGKCAPPDCPLFGKICNPEHPVGACMVSHEGACSAYYQYGGNF